MQQFVMGQIQNLIPTRKHFTVFPCFFYFLVLIFSGITVQAQTGLVKRAPAQASIAAVSSDPSLVGCVVTKSPIKGRIDAKDKN